MLKIVYVCSLGSLIKSRRRIPESQTGILDVLIRRVGHFSSSGASSVINGNRLSGLVKRRGLSSKIGSAGAGCLSGMISWEGGHISTSRLPIENSKLPAESDLQAIDFLFAYWLLPEICRTLSFLFSSLFEYRSCATRELESSPLDWAKGKAVVVVEVDKNSSKRVGRKHMVYEKITTVAKMWMNIDVSQQEKGNPQIKTAGDVQLYGRTRSSGHVDLPSPLVPIIQNVRYARRLSIFGMFQNRRYRAVCWLFPRLAKSSNLLSK